MDRSDIDRILEMNNIVDVVSSYIPLKKAGSNYKARCPFHEEKTASFVVSEKKQIFKCFGCGKGGNALTFVQDYEKISFPEALQKLAQRAGITITTTMVSKEKQSRRDLVYKIYRLAAAYYQDNLFKHGQFTLEYLQDRKISEETIKKFQIGYALDSHGGLKNYLLKNSINDQILPSTGLFTDNNNDLFRNRLMFPIHSSTGQVLAFGGRVLLENQGGGKYVNSPTTEIYTKGNELYGLFITKNEISRRDQALIAEGYTDFLRLYENGFTNSVASLGTSLTDSQIKILSRFTNNFLLVYDGDKAGRKAAVRAASNIIKNGYTVKIVNLPQTDDPDSFLVKNGSEKLQELLTDSQPLPEFLLEDTILNMDKRTKLNELIEILNEMEDDIARELFVQEISTTFKVSESAIFSKIRLRRKREKEPQMQTMEKFGEERELLINILNDSMYYKKVAQEIDSSYFLSEKYKKIYEIVVEHLEKMGQIPSLLETIEDEAIKNTIAELIMTDPPKAQIEDVINGLKLRKYQREFKQINDQILSNPKDMDLFPKKNELKKKIIGLNKKVVRKTLY
ncbi:MAG: DNA primase [Candidatus Cloacimonetes bacterium]|nr:DNA primase [Candidatus Cloacimonadota bacterium]MBL7148914.1 DNA primase [Candidatus Cloacimonadota bacterium]